MTLLIQRTVSWRPFVSEPTSIEALTQRVNALEAQMAARLPRAANLWTSADGVFDQSDEAVAFRLRIDEEIQRARDADRVELGLDPLPVGDRERQA